jgi:hypothetical protein
LEPALTNVTVCVCSQPDGHSGINFFVRPCGPASPAPSPTVTPITTTVDQALAELHLPDGVPVVAPDPANNEWDALAVGFPIWLTAGDISTHFGIITQNGITITIHATWAKTRFTTGDRDKFNNPDILTCAQGMATRPADLNPPATKSPNCGYAYQHKGIYTITAATTWRIDWTAGTFTGTFDHTITAQAAKPLVIGSLNAVNIEPPTPRPS